MNQKGQSLWEVIIALAIVGLVITGLAKAITMAVKGSRFSASQSSATVMTQKKIAELIDKKNKDWISFWAMTSLGISTDTSNEGYCLLTLVTDVTADNLPTETPNWTSAKMAKISVDVFWDEKGSGNDCNSKSYSHKLHFDTYATN